MADEALASFTSLMESVPTWIADLENISKMATKRQSDMLFEGQPVESRTPVLRKKTSKSSSLKSRLSQTEVNAVEQATTCASDPTLLQPQRPHMTNSDALRLSQRKRKTVSACSDNHSGPSKFRSRSMVIVYYDGDVQKRFETLVRAVGSCRNGIRKGKMAAKVDSLSRTGSSSSEASNSSGDERLDNIGKLGQKGAWSRRGQEKRLFSMNDGTEAFDRVDGLLEKAQTLCERAAHQILRDGDCALELNNAKDHLADAKEAAHTELPALRKKVEKAAARQRRSVERRQAEKEKEAENRAKAKQVESVVNAMMMPIPPIESRLEVDDLEADDSSEGDDDDFNVKTLQLGRYQMRSSRLVAH